MERTASTAAARPVFPPPGARDVCSDAGLVLELPPGARLGRSGRLFLFDAARPEHPVSDVELGAPLTVERIGGREFHLSSRVLLDGRRAHVRVRSGVFERGRRYFVRYERGFFLAPDESPLPALDGASWHFDIRSSKPADARSLSVAADGTGDFCTVQGALDFVPAGNAAPVVIGVAPGIYREILFASHKSAITLRGAGAATTSIAYANNETLQGGRGSRVRALASFEHVTDLSIEGFTFHNTTPQGGSQAEALRVDPGDQVTIRNSRFVSRQDTLLLTGRVYVADSFIEGNVDYVWGAGTAYFERVEMKTVARAGWNVQARNPPGRYGYVFVDSRFTADPGLTGHLLARIDAERYPGSHVAVLDCQMASHILPIGWEITPPGARLPNTLRFQEFGSKDPAGQPLDLGARHPAARRLSAAEARRLRDRRHVLAGWDPLAPLAR